MSKNNLRVKSIKNCTISGRFTVKWVEYDYVSCPLTGTDTDTILRRELKLCFDPAGNINQVSYFSNSIMKWKYDNHSNKFELIELKTLKKLIEIETRHNENKDNPKVYIQKLLLETIEGIINRNEKINFKGLKK